MICHTVFIALASSGLCPTSLLAQLPQPSLRQFGTPLRNQRRTPTAFLSGAHATSGREVRLRVRAFESQWRFPAPLARCRVSWSRLPSLYEAEPDRPRSLFVIPMSPSGKNGPDRRWQRGFVTFADKLLPAAGCPK